MAAIAASTPLARMAEPAEVAGLVLFSASDKATFMTGWTVIFEGGRVMR